MRLRKMQGAEMESHVYSEYEDQFQWFIGFALLLTLLNFLILERKNKYLKNIKLFGKMRGIKYLFYIVFLTVCAVIACSKRAKICQAGK